MKMVIVPKYSDLFDGPQPTIESLIKDIPSDLIISVLAVINAELQLNSQSLQVQIKIFNFLLGNQNADLRLSIFNKAMSLIRDDSEGFNLFSLNYTLDFLHYELTHYREFDFDDTTPEQELNLFKAYFLIVENSSDLDAKVFDNHRATNADFFYKNTWPILISQLEASNLVNPFTEMVKGQVLLNFLQ